MIAPTPLAPLSFTSGDAVVTDEDMAVGRRRLRRW